MRSWIVGLGTAGVAGAVARRAYRRDLARARQRLSSVDSAVIETRIGALEYADEGTGPPVLVSHGIFHGCDGGLLSVRDIVAGRRIIAPSRFGYLRSDLPAEASGAAQADAFAALLDHLELPSVDVVAVSAGTTAAVRFALGYPDRVDHLVVSSGSFPGSATAAAPPSWAQALYCDPAMWAMKAVARPAFRRLMGVPDGFPRDAAEAAVAEEMLDSIFPVGPRASGAVFDAYVSNPEIAACPLEELRTPTLLVHARDDPLASHDAAVEAGRRIPGARAVSLDCGGHLQLGQSARVRDEIESFLAG